MDVLKSKRMFFFFYFEKFVVHQTGADELLSHQLPSVQSPLMFIRVEQKWVQNNSSSILQTEEFVTCKKLNTYSI